MKIPKAYYRSGKYSKLLKKDAPVFHTKKPDIDNLCKFLFDCCNGVVFNDDSQIFQLSASKTYAELPRTEFTIIETNH